MTPMFGIGVTEIIIVGSIVAVLVLVVAVTVSALAYVRKKTE
jgi:hypothetical protein